jgi:uncharacterized protein (TIGR02598 family)
MTNPRRKPSGFSLVEVTLALGVAAFCLLAVSGLLTVGVQTNKRSISQNVATNIIAAAVSDLRATAKAPLGQVPGATPSLFRFALNGSTPPLYFDTTGGRTNDINAPYRLTVRTSNSGEITPLYVWLRVTWPGFVDPDNGTPDGSVESFAVVDLHY